MIHTESGRFPQSKLNDFSQQAELTVPSVYSIALDYEADVLYLNDGSRMFRYAVPYFSDQSIRLAQDLCELVEQCIVPAPNRGSAIYEALLVERLWNYSINTTVLGIYNHDLLAGMLSYNISKSIAEPDKKEIYINTLAVHPDFRKRGYGLLLIEDVIAKARRSEDCTGVCLNVSETNTIARNLYENKLNFEVIYRVEEFYGLGLHGLFLTLDTSK